MQASLALVLAFLMSAPQQSQQPVPDAPVPNAPSPQAPEGLSGLKNQVTPGKAPAAPEVDPNQPAPATSQGAAPASQAPAQGAPQQTDDQPQQEAPEIGTRGSNPYILPPAGVNIVVVPVTVRDSKGKIIPSLTYRDFRVYENKERQRITYFSTDAVPLSVAFVIDQSVSTGTMRKVNESLSAVTEALYSV